MISKYFEAVNNPYNGAREIISKEQFQNILRVKLQKTHSIEDLENVIVSVHNKFKNSTVSEDEMYIGDLFQEIYNPKLNSLIAKKIYVYNEFSNYFLTK
ncbi:MAG: hypothetical protein PHN56_03230 [Candidatus Nanoarchaeia archaeon]|nr:hypothetical protein [Candidatus Nanoarchaeia archaeon]